MIHRFRWLSAMVVNLLLPWLAYRLVLPHGGVAGALAASALPLIAWMSWDLARHRHFDALSAVVLVGVIMSLVTVLAFGGPHLLIFEAPLVSGMIGATFLVSLATSRPLVFYLARSTITRENPVRGAEFEQQWRERPALAASIRALTLVWGVGSVGENLVRIALVWSLDDTETARIASSAVQYSVYGALTLWTFCYRRRIKQEGEQHERMRRENGP
ncbi:VC0807 family protein [Paraburkholderia sp.]|uniref:VC0807 family protein n=1 Tax=Paraburkholderia sp. TaxID=1926495 RepID=UPI00239E7A67|nr:VC0807 family protein [Paraburkholderia sp.]MDE1180181.1 hypothetical protein [Paraburkholderia sp.]